MNIKQIKPPVYVYFIVLILLIVAIFPRERRFRYSFTEGRPWNYGLQTAPFNFPIYKSADDLKGEKDSILKTFSPYFVLNDTMADYQMKRFNQFFDPNIQKNHLSRHYLTYINQTLQKIYNDGIVSPDNYKNLVNSGHDSFMIIRDGVAMQYFTSEVFTEKSAYSYILDNCPADLDRNIIRNSNINLYLAENIKFDKTTSDKVKDQMIKDISPSIGMVQAGQKIIDKGEIVDGMTYHILSSLKRIYETRVGSVQRQGGLLLGALILVSGILSFLFCYLYFFKRSIYKSDKDTLFLLTIMAVFVLITEIVVTFSLFNVYLIPYAILPIVVMVFFDARTAQIEHLATVLICSLMVASPFEFIILQLCVSEAVVYTLKDLNRRSQLLKCSFLVLLTYSFVYAGTVFLQDGNLGKANWHMFIFFAVGFLFMMFSYALIYIIEKIFGYTSNLSLIELSDINNPLLRKLSETCPGTFQHSLQVSMLATSAAAKIGANTQLTRTGALYHDIGKMYDPMYFTENQVGYNPHDNLKYEESAKMIINHIPEGVKMAEKANLPSKIIDFIKTHHGKSKVRYFYNSYINKYPGRPVDEAAFTYPGPNPHSKETAILMMADSVEAASRSLKDYSKESISNLVDKIIDFQISEGLMSGVPLTFRDISEIKSVFTDKLQTMFHTRITYPELQKREEN